MRSSHAASPIFFPPGNEISHPIAPTILTPFNSADILSLCD
jgi:hypothetical protein